MFGVSRFKDRVAVIAGAEHPLGASLVRRLSAFGATVVAIGEDEERLYALARDQPGTVEPLALRPGRRDVLALLDEAWGDEPLDFYVDVMALCPGKDGPGQERVSASERFARSAGVAAAMMRGIRRARADAVMALPQAGPGAGPRDEARGAGYVALMRRLAAECRPGRMIGLRLPTDAATWRGPDCLAAGDAVLMLCHPVSRGLAGGQVIDWEPEGANGRPVR